MKDLNHHKEEGKKTDVYWMSTSEIWLQRTNDTTERFHLNLTIQMVLTAAKHKQTNNLHRSTKSSTYIMDFNYIAWVNTGMKPIK